jgi:hypothetical protein
MGIRDPGWEKFGSATLFFLGLGVLQIQIRNVNNPDYISESLETIFWVKNKYLNSLMRIQDTGWKIRLQDLGWKKLGSATLY